MISSFRVSVSLSKAKVNKVDLMLFLIDSDKEVIRFHVSVNEVVVVEVLQSLDHLVCDHQHALQRELPLAKCEQVFQRRPQ